MLFWTPLLDPIGSRKYRGKKIKKTKQQEPHRKRVWFDFGWRFGVGREGMVLPIYLNWFCLSLSRTCFWVMRKYKKIHFILHSTQQHSDLLKITAPLRLWNNMEINNSTRIRSTTHSSEQKDFLCIHGALDQALSVILQQSWRNIVNVMWDKC